jgi:hypothetical protein
MSNDGKFKVTIYGKFTMMTPEGTFTVAHPVTLDEDQLTAGILSGTYTEGHFNGMRTDPPRSHWPKRFHGLKTDAPLF